MGLVIGLAGDLEITGGKSNRYVRGLLLGGIVTFGLSLSTGFRDVPSFFAGLGYGLIIDYVASELSVIRDHG
ncbi:MAG: hypothetical protein ACLFQ8_03510 [Candidatus Aenigmatarchaeota archaeon]